MIPIGGMSTTLALKIVDNTRDTQIDLIRNAPEHSRSIEAFRERIADIETVDQLIEDREVYVFVMKAFDLEDQIFGKALIGKLLKSDIDDNTALVNRLTDPRFREMYKVLNFGPEGVGNPNTALKGWQDNMVDRYLETQFIGNQSEQNPYLGNALEFRRAAPDIESALDILKDRDLTAFIQRALGLPSEMSNLDIEKQQKLIEDKLDIETLQDPEAVDMLVRRFTALSDALDPPTQVESPLLTLVRGAATTLGAPIIPQIPTRPYGT